MLPINRVHATKPKLPGKVLKYFLCCMVAILIVLGTFSETHAAGGGQTITVVSRLVLWARPTLRSPVVAVLMRGRHFTVTARSVSGRWLYGFTDMGTAGWLPSFSFLRLHPEVNFMALPVRLASTSASMMMSGTRSGY